MPGSAHHDFAGSDGSFHFEELQIYGNAHLAVMPPIVTSSSDTYTIQDQFIVDSSVSTYTQTHVYNITLHFKYMIGDRTGTVHVAEDQDMDLERTEIDLPFNAYVYYGGHLGLAPDTYVHGRIILLITVSLSTDRFIVGNSLQKINAKVCYYFFLNLSVTLPVVTGVDIHMSGQLSHVDDLVIRHDGYMWLKHGGHTTGQDESHYAFDSIQ